MVFLYVSVFVCVCVNVCVICVCICVCCPYFLAFSLQLKCHLAWCKYVHNRVHFSNVIRPPSVPLLFVPQEISRPRWIGKMLSKLQVVLKLEQCNEHISEKWVLSLKVQPMMSWEYRNSGVMTRWKNPLTCISQQGWCTSQRPLCRGKPGINIFRALKR